MSAALSEIMALAGLEPTLSLLFPLNLSITLATQVDQHVSVASSDNSLLILYNGPFSGKEGKWAFSYTSGKIHGNRTFSGIASSCPAPLWLRLLRGATSGTQKVKEQ